MSSVRVLVFVVQLVGDSGSTVVDDSQTVNDEVEFTEVRQQNRVEDRCEDRGIVKSSCENECGGYPLCLFERSTVFGSPICQRMIVRPS